MRHPRRLLSVVSTGCALAVLATACIGFGDTKATSKPAPGNASADSSKGVIKVFIEDGDGVVEVTFVNHSRGWMKVPRWPRMITWEFAEPKVESPGTIRSGPAQLFREKSIVELGPGEGFIKRIKMEELNDGKYKVVVALPDGYAGLTPDPVPFTMSSK